MEFNATFLISIVSFVLFTIIMNKIFYKPIGNIITERNNFVQGSLDDAKYSNDKADSILKERDEKLQNALSNAKLIVSTEVTNANNIANNNVREAKLKSQDDILKAKEDLKYQAATLDSDMDSEIKKLAGIMASKVLGFETNIEDV